MILDTTVLVAAERTAAALDTVVDDEDDVAIAAFSLVIDADHTFERGTPNVMQNPLSTAPVRVGQGTWIGQHVAVLCGSDIGRCCIIGANSVVRGTIPDYSIAVGAPARVVGSTRGWFEPTSEGRGGARTGC